MATTGTVLAKNMKMYSSTTAYTCQTDVSISMSTNMIQTSCKDDAADASYLPGEKSWTASVAGLQAFDATEGFTELFADWDNQTAISLVYQTAVTGDKKYSGSAYITSLSNNSSGNDEAVTWTAELQGTGALVEATVS